MRCCSTSTCMSNWILVGGTTLWLCLLTPVWLHHHPTISRAECTTWSAMGKTRLHIVSPFEHTIYYDFENYGFKLTDLNEIEKWCAMLFC